MTDMVKVFFDTEFTGLHQNTTLISIGCVDEHGRQFYAELDDYDLTQVDDWIKENVTNRLWIQNPEKNIGEDKNLTYRCDNKEGVALALSAWLHETSRIGTTYGDVRNIYTDTFPKKIEMWGDCLSFDWFLFCGLFGHAFHIPDSVYYIPFDICTLFKINGIDPDINREDYAGIDKTESKHNALWDAMVIKACYERLMK